MSNNTFKNIINSRCPNCGNSKMFESPWYKLGSFRKMKNNCSSCGQAFNPEPSFYTGAMYVSYAFSVAIVVGVFIGANILSDDPSVNTMVFYGILIAFLFAPLNYRLSRTIWAYVVLPRNKK